MTLCVRDTCRRLYRQTGLDLHSVRLGLTGGWRGERQQASTRSRDCAPWSDRSDGEKPSHSLVRVRVGYLFIFGATRPNQSVGIFYGAHELQPLQ